VVAAGSLYHLLYAVIFTIPKQWCIVKTVGVYWLSFNKREKMQLIIK